ncbi:hypothetical protein ACW95P_03175 [Candidatus Mycoplasma pogonae]
MDVINKKNSKTSIAKKSALLVLSVTPLIISFTAISAIDSIKEGESLLSWINRNFTHLTHGQKEAFATIPRLWGKDRTQSLIKLNNIMKEYRDTYEKYQDYINNNSSPLYNHFWQADTWLQQAYQRSLNDFYKVLDKDKAEFRMTDIGDLNRRKSNLTIAWNNLNGFSKSLVSFVEEMSNLTKGQKDSLKILILDKFKAVSGSSVDNVNISFINEINKLREQITEFNTMMKKIKDEFVEFSKKENNSKFYNSSSEAQNAYNTIFENAEKANFSTFIPNNFEKELANIKNVLQIMEKADSKLDAASHIQQLVATRQAEIRKLDHLSSEAKVKFNEKIENLLLADSGITRYDGYNEAMNQVVVEATSVNTSFSDLEKAFLEYRNALSTINYTEANNKNIEDENVFKALEKVLLDTGRTGSEANTLWRPSNKLLTTTYDISKLKIKPNVSATDIQNSIKAINDAKAALNGIENLRNQKVAKRNTVKGEINRLNRLNSDLKKQFTDQINAFNVDDATETLASFEAKITPIKENAVAINETWTNLLDAFLKFRTKYHKNPDGTRSSVNRWNEWDKVRRNLETLIGTLWNGGFANNYKIDDAWRQYKPGTTVEKVNEVIKKIDESTAALNGAFVVARENLLNKLNHSPLNTLNQKTKDAVTEKINSRDTNSIEKLQAIEEKITSLASVAKTINTKVVDMNSYKSNQDFTFATPNLQTAYQTKLAELAIKNTENIFSDSTTDLNALIAAVDSAKNALDGNSVRDSLVNSVKTNISNLTHLSSELINEFKTKVDNILKDNPTVSKTNFEQKLNDVETQATRLNDEHAKIAAALAAYQTTMTTEKYTRATNGASEDENVFKALESVLLDTTRTGSEGSTLWRPRNGRLTREYEVNNLKIKPGIDIATVTTAITKINTAKDALNGDVVAAKEALKAKLNQAPLNKLNDQTKFAIISEIDNATTDTTKKVKTIEDKITPLVAPTESIAAKIAEMEAYKSNVDYTLANADLKTAYDSALNTLKIKNTANIFNDTVHSLTALVQLGTTTKDNLNGTEKLQSQKQAKAEQVKLTINSLNKLNNNLKNEFKQKIDDLLTATTSLESLDEFSNKIISIQTKATTLNSSFTNINAALIKFRDKYYVEPNGNLSTNWGTEKEKVLSAIDEVVTIRLSRDLTRTYNLQNNSVVMFKPGATTEKIEQIIAKINTATAALNGEVIAKQNALKAELAQDPLNKLSSTVIQKITQEINRATTLEALSSIETRINTAKSVVEKVDQEITKLNTFKNSNNYKLSDDAKKTAFDAIYTNITSFLSKDLFADAKISEANTKLDEAKSIELNGDANLRNSKAKIDRLSNLSVVQKAQANAKLDDRSKIDTKAKLTIADTTLNDINTILGIAKSEASNLNHLMDATKNRVVSDLEAIDITNITKEQTQTKINEILDKQKALNNKFDALKNALKNYTNLIGETKHTFADNKVAVDNEVLEALKSVLSGFANTTLTKMTSIDSYKLSAADTTAVDTVISAINAAVNKLKGDEELTKAENKINALTNLSSKQKQQAIAKIKDATKVNSKSALDSAVAIFTAINNKLGQAKTDLNGLSHLNATAQTTTTNKLNDIDITDLDANSAQRAFDAIVNKEKALNDKFSDLKAALKTYIDGVETPNHVLATNKFIDDKKVIDALKAVLENFTSDTLTNPLNIDRFKFSAIETTQVESAINNIDAAFANWDGNNNKTNAINSINSFANISSGKRADILAKINNLSETNSKAKLDDLVAKFNEINTEIGTKKTTLRGLTNFSNTLKNSFETILADIDINQDKNTIKTGLQTTVNTATAVNNKFSELESALNSYIATIGTPKHDLATTKNIQDNKVKTALNGVIAAPNFANISKTTTLTGKKLSANTVTQVESAINEIKAALTALNGNDVLKDKKSALVTAAKTEITKLDELSQALKNNYERQLTVLNTNDASETEEQFKIKVNAIQKAASDLAARKKQSKEKLKAIPLNELNTKTITEIEKQINDATNTSALDTLDTKALNVANKFKALKDKVSKLEDYKANDDYIFAKQTKKDTFDASLTALKAEQDKNESILDTNPSNFDGLINAAETAKNNLDGTENLAEAIRKVNALTNLSTAQKTQANNKLKDQTKVNSQTTLNNAVSTLTNIDTKLAAAKTVVNNLDHLKDDVKTALITQLKKIDITDLTTEKVQEKIDSIISEPKALNDKFNDLKSVVKNYTNQMGEATHLLATTNPIATDNEVLNAVKSVLDGITASTLSKNFSIDDKKFSATSASVVQTTIDNIKAAFAKLDGNSNLIVAENTLKTLTNLSTTQNNQAIAKIKDLTKINSKAKLDNAVTELTKVNTELGNAKTELISFNNLVESTKTNAITQLGAIDIADKTAAEVKIAINLIVDIPKYLNDKFNDLKNKLKTYTDEIGQANHSLANNLTAVDQEVIAALQSVLKNFTTTTLSNTTNIDTLKISVTDKAKLDSALSAIETAITKLNGDNNKTTALTEIDKLTNITEVKRNLIKAKINDLSTINTKAKLDNLVTKFKTINDDIATQQASVDKFNHLSESVKNHFKNQLC